MSNDAQQQPAETATCFYVGVSGYMDLVPEEIDPIKERIRRLFQFLRRGATGERLDELVADLVPDSKNGRLRHVYKAALSRWTGLGKKTPIVVLCNLAPGTDTLVANLVLDKFRGDNFQVLCPLPFPPHIYCGASTFVRDGKPVEDNRARQQGFLRVLEKMDAISPGLAELADGNQDLPPDLDAALRNISPERFYAVPLQEDLSLDQDVLERKWLSDRDDRELRHRRYYAAGEYLTATSHLLVAVWNGQREGSRSGTSAVVQARLSGPEQGLLATTSDVPLQHGGPVWHVLANRPNSSPANVEQCSQTRDVSRPLPPVRILHPFIGTAGDCPQAVVVAAGQAADIPLQRDRLRLLTRIHESLRNFNTKPVPADKDASKNFDEMLSDPELAGALGESNSRFLDRLRNTSDVYCRASNLTAFFQKRVKRTLARLFWITFLAAVALHFFTHWHPRKTKEETTAAANAASETDEKKNHSHDEHLNSVQIVSGWLALLLTAVAVVHFGWQRSRKLEANDHDARAIAEGLRVQFYWNLAGLGHSVSANYMSRHRSELDWIRGVIRNTSIPYEIWTSWFRGLNVDIQLRAIRTVQRRWVQHQLAYFRNAGHREHHKLHLWHKFGGVAALAGVLAYLKLVGQESWPAIAGVAAVICHGWLAVVLLVAIGCLSVYLAMRGALRNTDSGHDADGATFPELNKVVADAPKRAKIAWDQFAGRHRRYLPVRVGKWGWSWFTSACAIGLEIVNILVPAPRDSSITQTNFGRRLVHGALSFGAYLPLALVVASASCGLAHLLAGWFDTFPGPLTLGIIFAGTLLLGGALSVAWAEKRLYSELAYQYNTMAALFEAADQQLGRQLADLETAIRTGDVPAQVECIRRIQALLFELGKQALDENAEWLLLHRARPLEPVMAG